MSVLKERCSGGCNVFHVLATLSKPQEPQSSSSSSGGSLSSSAHGEKRGVAARTTPRGGMLREIMKQAMALASGSSYPHPSMGKFTHAPLIIKKRLDKYYFVASRKWYVASCPALFPTCIPAFQCCLQCIILELSRAHTPCACCIYMYM